MNLTPLLLAMTACSAIPAPGGTPYSPALAQRAKDVMLQALRGEKGIVQVHAADALVAFVELDAVRAVFSAQLPIDPASPFRVGAWRSLAGAALSPADRATWVKQIEREFLDRKSTLRVGAIESLCKLGHVASGEVLEAAREMAATGSDADAVFARWALHLAGDTSALSRVAGALTSTDPAARLRAAYVMRWTKPRDPVLRAKLARAADSESSDTIAYPYVLSAALALQADPARMETWQREADKIIAKGATGPRYEICQTLMNRIGPGDLAPYLPLLDQPEGDARIAGAWLVRFVLEKSERAMDGQPRANPPVSK